MEGKTIHLQMSKEHIEGNNGINRYILIPGSLGRAEMISTFFDAITGTIKNPRGLDVYLGTINVTQIPTPIDVGVVTSGMGPGSYEIVHGELLSLGVKRVVRVGTSGTLQPNIDFGNYVISTGAVRDEMASRHMAPVEFPAICHTDWVVALRRAARELKLSNKTFEGPTHSKDSLWAREGGFDCPNKDENLAYKKKLTAGRILNSEMEISVGLIQASCKQSVISVAEAIHSSDKIIKIGGLCVVVNNYQQPGTDEEEELFSASEEEIRKNEEILCRFAIEGVKQLALIDYGICPI